MSTETIKLPHEMTDSEYLLALLDETFINVPQVRAHHQRMREIAAKLAALNAPPEAPAVEAVLSDEQIDKMVDRHYRTTRHPDSYTALRATIRDCIQAALAEKP